MHEFYTSKTRLKINSHPGIYKNHNSQRQAETWPSIWNEMQKLAGGQHQKSLWTMNRSNNENCWCFQAGYDRKTWQVLILQRSKDNLLVVVICISWWNHKQKKSADHQNHEKNWIPVSRLITTGNYILLGGYYNYPV